MNIGEAGTIHYRIRILDLVEYIKIKYFEKNNEERKRKS